jgi:hypothetical protein
MIINYNSCRPAIVFHVATYVTPAFAFIREWHGICTSFAATSLRGGSAPARNRAKSVRQAMPLGLVVSAT